MELSQREVVTEETCHPVFQVMQKCSQLFLQTVSNCAEGSPMANQAACFVAEALTDDNDHRAARAADYDPMGLFDLS